MSMRFFASFRRLLVPLGILLVSFVPVGAAAELANGKGVLWRVSAPGGAPSYVFGTLHSTDPRVLDLPEPVAEAFQGAKHLAVELETTPQVRLQLSAAMLLTDSRSLDQILGPELFARVANAAQAYGLQPVQLKLFKPWGLLAVFAVPPAEVTRNLRGIEPLDLWLQAEAQRRGMTVLGLETVEEQLAVFENMSEAEQVAMLESTLDVQEDIDGWFERLLGHYLARDIAAIYALMSEQSASLDPKLAADFEKRLIDQRNAAMAERSLDLLRKGNAFIAVGALHLPGEKGVLRLLEDWGYNVTRVY